MAKSKLSSKDRQQSRRNGFVRIAVIGTGGMGRGHCRCIQSVPHARLAAVCDTNLPSAEEVGHEWSVPHFGDHRDLIKAGVCDLVLIATPHPFHMQVAVDAMQAGLHVISEKPLTESIATAEKMVLAAKRHKVVFTVMFQMRFSPNMVKARELIQAGHIGAINRTMLVDLQYRSQSYYDAGRWRATWRGEGGGVMMNQSPHMLDMFVQLAGLPSQVLGITSTRMHKIEVEDQAEALLRYSNGGVGYLYCTTCETAPGQTIAVCGDKGKLLIRDGKLSFYQYHPSLSEHVRKSADMWGSPQVWEVPVATQLAQVAHSDYEDSDRAPLQAVSHTQVIKNTVDNILFGAPLVTPGESGLGSLELANAITLSSHTGGWVKLPISRVQYAALLEKLRRSSKGEKKNVREQRVTDPRIMAK